MTTIRPEVTGRRSGDADLLKWPVERRVGMRVGHCLMLSKG